MRASSSPVIPRAAGPRNPLPAEGAAEIPRFARNDGVTSLSPACALRVHLSFRGPQARGIRSLSKARPRFLASLGMTESPASPLHARFLRKTRRFDALHPGAERLLGLHERVRVLPVRRRFHDRARAKRGIVRLEDPGA